MRADTIRRSGLAIRPHEQNEEHPVRSSFFDPPRRLLIFVRDLEVPTLDIHDHELPFVLETELRTYLALVYILAPRDDLILRYS